MITNCDIHCMFVWNHPIVINIIMVIPFCTVLLSQAT